MRSLFRDQPLADYCAQRRAQLAREVSDWDPEDLLATPDQEIIDYLVSSYSVTCPVLHPGNGWSTEPETVSLPVSSPIPGFAVRGQPERRVPGTKITIIIPYDGDEEVFFRRPNPFTHISRPLGAEVHPGQIRLTWQQDQRRPLDPDQIHAYVDEQLTALQHNLAESARDLDMSNREIAAFAARQVSARKARMQQERAATARLRYPVKRRPDADQYQIPLRRRLLRPQPRPAAASEGPEFWLADADFEAALAVLRHSRNALERSPSLTARLGETQIRDLLLVNLNTEFEGQAGGEVFNNRGKSDILIRVQDTNVFIGECKIWAGTTRFRRAIDQLLGYLTWRDTKGALLLFIRQREVTAVIKKATATIEEHPSYVSTLPVTDPDGRHDFMLHADGDRARQLRLAFLPFALGPAASFPADSSTA